MLTGTIKFLPSYILYFHFAVVQALVESNCSLNKPRSDVGATSLWIASQEGHSAIVKILIDAGADLVARSYQSDPQCASKPLEYRGRDMQCVLRETEVIMVALVLSLSTMYLSPIVDLSFTDCVANVSSSTCFYYLTYLLRRSVKLFSKSNNLDHYQLS